MFIYYHSVTVPVPISERFRFSVLKWAFLAPFDQWQNKTSGKIYDLSITQKRREKKKSSKLAKKQTLMFEVFLSDCLHGRKFYGKNKHFVVLTGNFK